jgi:predicted flap endonuclease-1-like 5' DNA nuclease
VAEVRTPVEFIRNVEVPVEVVREVPVEVVREIEKIVEVPVDVVREVERIVEVPYEVIKEVEKVVEMRVEVPVETVKEIEMVAEVRTPIEVVRRVEIPVEIERIVEVPIEVVREVAKIVEVPVQVVREKVVEVPVEVIRYVDRQAEVNLREVDFDVDEAKVASNIKWEGRSVEHEAGTEATTWEVETKTKKALTKKVPATLQQKDDLKVIEGIGPKIESILNAAGIWTFDQLASMTANQIKDILDQAGPRYKIHDPTTWPLQSELAAAGSWEELRAWQDQLNAGKL